MRYQITTPEQVHFHYEIAGLASRAMAWALDQLILWAARIAVAFAFIWGGFGIGLALIILGVFLLDFGYYQFFEVFWAGQSPGKKVFKIRVISGHGGKLRFPDVFLRNIMRPFDTLPYAMGLGGVVAYLDPLRRRLGDKVAETLVVRDVRVELPQSVLTQQTRVNTFEADGAIRSRILARVTREERDLILDLMLRRDGLDPSVREDLFSQAAEYFRERYGLPEDLDYLTDEQTVLNLALVLQHTKFTG
jgi:uncharacterized RDD family membrane protein YckC